MFRLTRIVAALLLALAPLIGAQSVGAIGRDAWPTYPSLYFSSTLCQFSGGSGSGFINCAPGGQIVSQINSGYQCNQINVTESGYEAGPISLTMVTNDGLNSQTISIDGNGTWYVQIPGPFPLNAVVLEFSMPDGAGFLLPDIYSTPCPVATSTPTSAPSNTPNPSFTATPTVNPSYTVTPIPTYTPLPSGHTTFTPTLTPTPGPPTSTPPPSIRNCGDSTFPVLNCDFVGGSLSTNPVDWTNTNMGAGAYLVCMSGGVTSLYQNGGAPQVEVCKQSITAHATGNVYMRYQWTQWAGGEGWYAQVGTQSVGISSSGCTIGSSGWCLANIASVTAGISYTMGWYIFSSPAQESIGLYIDRIWVGSTPDTPTPGPTGSFTATPTPTVGTPSATPYVNPFWTATPTVPGTPGTAIPTDTECPGGCAVAALTTVPGISTMVTVDTSPFSPLLHLSLSRSPCTPFGYVQIPYPVITGTPALGQPLNFGWTVPVTHTWDDTNIITNTAIQPCAMAKEVTPYVWDFTYWGSGVALAIVFTIWLIGWVGRLSGDHTVDG